MRRYEWICLVAMIVCSLFFCACTNTLTPDERAEIEMLQAIAYGTLHTIERTEIRITNEIPRLAKYLPISTVDNYDNFSYCAIAEAKKIVTDCQVILSNIPDNINKDELKQRLFVANEGLLLANKIGLLVANVEQEVLTRGLIEIKAIEKATEVLQSIINSRSEMLQREIEGY